MARMTEQKIMAENIQYLDELRSRLLRCLFVISGIFLILSFFAKRLYDWLAIPLLTHLPQGQTLIATAITGPFIAPFKLAFIVAIFIAAPYLFYQLWTFIAPALYKHERRWIWLLIISIILFYLGAAFAYFFILPWIFKFLIYMAPSSVEIKPDMNQFLDFTLRLFLVFGITFEVPIITLLLIKSGLTSIETLQKKRPYIIVGAFVVGMLLTPPDVISQIMLAIPLWLLFELGLFLAKISNQSTKIRY